MASHKPRLYMASHKLSLYIIITALTARALLRAVTSEAFTVQRLRVAPSIGRFLVCARRSANVDSYEVGRVATGFWREKERQWLAGWRKTDSRVLAGKERQKKTVVGGVGGLITGKTKTLIGWGGGGGELA